VSTGGRRAPRRRAVGADLPPSREASADRRSLGGGGQVRRNRLAVSVVTSAASATLARGLAAWLAGAAPASARGAVAVALVSDARMRRLNRTFRGVDEATDVLSFEAGTPLVPARGPRSAPDLGEMAIAVGVARRQAGARGHSVGTELRILALHGLLHLLGYDHETDQGDMRRREERLRRAAGLPTGLITRTPGRHTER